MLIQNNYQSRMGVPLFYYSSSTSPLLQTTTLPIHNNNSNSKSIAANSFNYYPVTPPYSHQYDYHLKSYPSSDFSQHQYSGQRYLETSPSPLVNTPPITPPSEPSITAAAYSSTPANTQHLRNRNSVIMKVKDHQITSVMSALSLSKTLSNDSHSNSSDLEEILCKWENCFQHFNTLEDLSAHVSQVHAMAGLKGLYYCKWEGCARTERGFNARYKMLVHSRTHTKDKPHQCSECSKCFSRAENLKIHKRSHSGEKPYLCPVEGCNKAYSNSSDRFKHTRTHTNDKPYVCKIPGCQKRYTDPSSLRKHLKTFKHPVAETLEDVVDVDAKFASHLIISSQESHTKDLRSLEDRVMSVAEQELMDNDSMVFSGGVLYKAENSGNESVEELCRVNSYEQYTHSSHYYENNFYLWNGKSSDCFPTDNMPLDLSIHRR